VIYIRAAQRLDHFQIIVDLMDAEDVRASPDGMRQQKAAAVGAVAGPHADAGHISDDGGFDGVLQQNGRIELFRPERIRQAKDARRIVEFPRIG